MQHYTKHFEKMPKRSRTSYGARKVLTKRRKPASDKSLALRKAYTMLRGVVPNKTTVILKYSDTVQLVDTLVGFSAQVLKVNSCFDPDDTIGGHQPLGFDEHAAFYQNYRVTKAEVVGHFCNNQSTVPVLVGMTPSETNVTTVTQAQMERPGTKMAMLAQDTGGSLNRELDIQMDIAAFDGNAGARSDDRLQAAVAADPADLKYVQLWARSGVGALTVDVALTFELYMTVEFFNRRSLSIS